MLNFKKFGDGEQVLIILHGLFGSLDNWQSVAKIFAKDYTVYILDQRNHGKSPHYKEHNYSLMSVDLDEFMSSEIVEHAHLLGHSMGGKTVMQFAVDFPHKLDKLIVADIAPKYYEPHHQLIIKALTAVDFNKVNNRREVEYVLAKYIKDPGVCQFLLKGLTWVSKEKMGWKFNLETLSTQIENIGEALDGHVYFTNPTLFLKGENSNYIKDEDLELIEACFPVSDLVQINNAGHWLHAENQKDFVQEVLTFLK
ncbi:MAG: esterase [Saprospiraceae bacterium]|jgi:esterase